MPAQHLLLLSSDDVLANSVARTLAPGVELTRCRSLKEAAESACQFKIWGCLGDFRPTIVGGHAEERFLDGSSRDSVRHQATLVALELLLP